ILKKSNLFEAFRFRYFGPTDGHDVIKLVRLLKDLNRIEGPKLLHVITKKGKGLTMAENKPTTYHSPGTFDKKTGEIHSQTSNKKLPPKYQDVFGETIVELAEKNEKILGITPAMPTGSSLNIMMEKIPERAFDVGIAEQHAVTFSAGLATQGFIPFCNIYSTFMQRAYDQIIHDVALQKLNVVFCLDRGGLVGEDGPTHHGAFDLAYLRTIPNIIIAAPMNEEELRNMMFTAQTENAGTFSIRYPRGRGVMPEWKTPFKKMEIGKGEKIRDGKDIAIISIGHPGNSVKKACTVLSINNIEAAHYNIRFLKPLDEDILHEVFKAHTKIITVEDGTIIGGLGSAVIEFMNDNGYKASVKRLGIPDEFIPQGSPDDLTKICGYDINGIIEAALLLANTR
ncbi:MAG: 1-deoxy-D-xylulose-5-phosphate synthase, partial [Bacteroidetes bacterium]